MGNNNPCQCQSQLQGQRESLYSINKNLEVYATNNNLILYDHRTRALLQGLVVFRQQHISDKLIQLIRNNMQQQKKQMLYDLERINLQEFDEICHKSLYPEKINANSNNNKIGIINSVPLSKLSYKNIQQGEQQLRAKRFLFIITIECFYLQSTANLDSDWKQLNRMKNPFQKTNLLSRKSYIQIFEQKLQALRNRYDTNYQVYIICPKKDAQRINNCLINHINAKNKFNQGSILSIMSNNSAKRALNYTILQFQPNQPCFSNQNKIKLFGNKIQFNQHQGDLVDFLFTHPTIKNRSINNRYQNFFANSNQQEFQYKDNKFDYIVFHDLNNLVSPAINPAHLGLLTSNNKLKILSTVVTNQNQKLQNVQVQNDFISTKNMKFSDTIIKTQLIEELCIKNNQLSSAFAFRIQRRLVRETNNSFYLHRLPQDILHVSISEISKVPYYASDVKQYSNFCKKALDIFNQNEKNLIQIGIDLLHGVPKELQKIKNMLRTKEGELSYPIVIIKSKTEISDNTITSLDTFGHVEPRNQQYSF